MTWYCINKFVTDNNLYLDTFSFVIYVLHIKTSIIVKVLTIPFPIKYKSMLSNLTSLIFINFNNIFFGKFSVITTNFVPNPFIDLKNKIF